MITFDVTLDALPDRREEMCALMRRAMQGSAAEPGCLLYRFTQDLDTPTRFHLSEVWNEEADLIAHVKATPFRDFIAALPQVGKITGSVARQGSLAPYTFALPKP